MKKIATTIILSTLLIAATLLVGCDNNSKNPPKGTDAVSQDTVPMTEPVTKPEATKPITLPPVTVPPETAPVEPVLEFGTRGDGTCTVDGIGTCQNVADLVIPSTSPAGDTVDGFGYGAFKNCKNLVTVVVPDTVTSLMWWTFSGCTSLESVVLPAGITEVLSYAFNNCKALKTIYFKGTEEQWNSIQVTEEGNGLLSEMTVVFNYGTDAE